MAACTILVALFACTPGAIEMGETSSVIQPSQETARSTTETPLLLDTPTLRSLLTVLPAPDGQLLQNANFESSTQGWDARFGEFIHTTYESNTGTGSGRLITSSVDARGDYTGLVGQCVPLTGGAAQLEITLHINVLSGGSYVNVSGVYTDDERCRGTHVGTFSVLVGEGDGWLVIHEVIDVPDGANSLDFLISCAGAGPDAGILVDDVHLSPQIPP